MKTLIFTLAFVAVAWGCTEETITCMPISKSLPIHFVGIDEQVYNEQEYPGVYKPCFCQPWKCATELPVQVPYHEGFDPDDQKFVMTALDSDNQEVQSWDLYPVGANAAGIKIDPEEDLCDKDVRFVINSVFTVMPEFDAAPTFGTSKVIGGNEWGSQPTFVFSNTPSGDPTPFSDIHYWPLPGIAGDYFFDFDINRINGAGDGGSSLMFFVLLDASLNVIKEQPFASFHIPEDLSFGTKNKTGSIPLKVGEDAVYIGIRYTMQSPSASATIQHNMHSLEITSLVVPKYHSWCVSFRTEFPDMDLTLIEYWDVRDWDDIRYAQTSPPQTFRIWVPAVFWKDRFVSEQREHRTSNKRVVKMNSSLITQRLLETEHLPIPFQEKIIHILSHNQVWIKKKQYTNGEGLVMEEDTTNKFAFQKSNTWLTDAESALNNVI